MLWIVREITVHRQMKCTGIFRGISPMSNGGILRGVENDTNATGPAPMVQRLLRESRPVKNIGHRSHASENPALRGGECFP